MQMTNGELLNLSAAIAAAGHEPVPGSDKMRQRHLPWRLTYALARTTAAIKPLLEALEAGRVAIFAATAKGADVLKPGDPGFTEYEKQYGELLKEQVDAPVHCFDLADIEGISLPPAVLTALLPLIEE